MDSYNFPQVTQLAIPFFVVAILIELWLVRTGRARGSFETRDTLTSLMMGTGNVVAARILSGELPKMVANLFPRIARPCVLDRRLHPRSDRRHTLCMFLFFALEGAKGCTDDFTGRTEGAVFDLLPDHARHSGRDGDRQFLGGFHGCLSYV